MDAHGRATDGPRQSQPDLERLGALLRLLVVDRRILCRLEGVQALLQLLVLATQLGPFLSESRHGGVELLDLELELASDLQPRRAW